MENKISGMTNKQKEVFRKPILKEIQKLIKKYGENRVKYSCNWFFTKLSGRRKREKQIRKLKKEIDDLKKGKNPDYA